jgi:hydrogenase/urease accessory protein HupE
MTTRADAVCRALAVVAAVVTFAAPVAAHPLATATVSIVASGTGTLNLTIAADADALIARLEALAGSPVSLTRTSAERRARIESLSSTLVAHIELRSGESPLALRLQDVVIDETAQAEIRLTTAMPAGADSVTWRTTLVARSYPIAVRSTDGHEVVEWLQGPQLSRPLELDAPRAPAGFINGLVMGFTHIVPAGLDHVLFVLGLFLLSRQTREVLLQVTAFTIAHSITLGLSLYGVVSAPASIVEPMIALSVAYVGVENLMTSRLHPWRVAVVFGFGLLHGMGFAEALAGLHLSRSSFVMTLVSFNLGVEAGQLTVIAAAAVVLAFVGWLRASASVPTIRFASAAIGLVGTIWTIQRISGG